MNRHPSTIGREVRRNIWRENGVTYQPLKTQSYTNERRRVARRGTLWTHLRVVTMVERKSGFLAIGQLDRCGATETTTRLKQLIDAQPHRVHTLTLDNGTESHAYKQLEAMVDTVCYFATPHLTQRDCQRIADKLNRRPRKRIGLSTPAEVYAQ